ncbi:hypothetical protein TW95_gp0551 [Pandoravirus inopinatum]|uniref:Uncharacterized protein n=1 Tax=Pandoravirus inopinatum TaxID=1605721 RepID=A0A0B5J6B5_9VIRU|nr:hypothetical protein TW95_gp0551 [Pandoravirus inopinatum]AJF97285.1 hypothetical protein [Pandoravirus inopinatum]
MRHKGANQQEDYKGSALYTRHRHIRLCTPRFFLGSLSRRDSVDDDNFSLRAPNDGRRRDWHGGGHRRWMLCARMCRRLLLLVCHRCPLCARPRFQFLGQRRSACAVTATLYIKKGGFHTMTQCQPKRVIPHSFFVIVIIIYCLSVCDRVWGKETLQHGTAVAERSVFVILASGWRRRRQARAEGESGGAHGKKPIEDATGRGWSGRRCKRDRLV